MYEEQVYALRLAVCRQDCGQCMLGSMCRTGGNDRCLFDESANAIEDLSDLIERQRAQIDVLSHDCKTARWKLHRDGSATCSACHHRQAAVWDQDNWQNYCGVCGAEMTGVEPPKEEK